MPHSGRACDRLETDACRGDAIGSAICGLPKRTCLYRNFLSKKAPLWVNRGFTIKEILERSENFVEYLEEHGMLSAGTTSVQGKTPKFRHDARTRTACGMRMLPCRTQGRRVIFWSSFPGVAIWQTGKFLKTKRLMFVSPVKWVWLSVNCRSGEAILLFIPRFDRTVTETGVIRHHQESIASLCQLADASERPSHNVA